MRLIRWCLIAISILAVTFGMGATAAHAMPDPFIVCIREPCGPIIVCVTEPCPQLPPRLPIPPR